MKVAVAQTAKVLAQAAALVAVLVVAEDALVAKAPAAGVLAAEEHAQQHAMATVQANVLVDAQAVVPVAAQEAVILLALLVVAQDV